MDDTTPQDVPAEDAPARDVAGEDVRAEDAAVARLRAADPAADVEPDAVALRAAVDERLAADAPAVTDELAARRARRWTSWPARIAGVAAAALVVGGGGGYAIGAAGSPEQGPTAEAAITLDSGVAGATTPGWSESAAIDAPAIAPRATDMAAGDSAYWPGMWWGRTVFTAAGLSGDAGTLRAWALDPSASFTEATVTAMAAALGVAGTPASSPTASGRSARTTGPVRRCSCTRTARRA